MFFDMQKYIYSESLFNALYIEREHKCSSTLFLLQTPSYYSFTFNLRFLYELKHKFCLSQNVCRTFRQQKT